MNHVVNFLEFAAKVTTKASGSNYTTISLQPLIYQKLLHHCNETILFNPDKDTGEVISKVGQAAKVFKKT